MAWVAVHKNGNEGIFIFKPYRDTSNPFYELRTFDFWSDENSSSYGNEDTEFSLPKGSIKKLIGRELTWEDEPVELKDE